MSKLPKKVKQDKLVYTEAAKELNWYFTCAESAMGYSAQNYNPDVFGQTSLSDCKFNGSTYKAAEKYNRIQPIITKMSSEDMEILARVFVPKQWCIVSNSSMEYPNDSLLRSYFKLGSSGINLLGLAFVSNTVLKNYKSQIDIAKERRAKVKNPRKEFREETVLEYLMWLIGLGKADLLEKIRSESSTLFNRSLSRYDLMRRERNKVEKLDFEIQKTAALIENRPPPRKSTWIGERDDMECDDNV